MRETEILQSMAWRETVLHDCLQELDRALNQTSGDNYDQCRIAISNLRTLCSSLEAELRHHIRFTEAALLPMAEGQVPRLSDVLSDLSHEHDAILSSLVEFHHELIRFNSSGDSCHLRVLGQGLEELLRRHIAREAEELVPLLRGCLNTGAFSDRCGSFIHQEIEPLARPEAVPKEIVSMEGCTPERWEH